MIDALSFTNLNSVSITLNDFTYPVNNYEDEITGRFERRPKSGQNGAWPTFPYEEGMEITMEGDILGNDSNDYWTKRYALTSCLRYKPSPPLRRDGTLFVTFTNAPEQFKVDVVIESLSIARGGLSPARSAFRLVLFSFTPYYIGVSSGNPFYDS